VVALAIKTDDEHWAAMAIANRLIGGEERCIASPGRGIADAFAKAAAAEFIGAAKEFNGIVGVIRSQSGLHGAEMLIAERQDVHPHGERV